jgi:hypothetical protein
LILFRYSIENGRKVPLLFQQELQMSILLMKPITAVNGRKEEYTEHGNTGRGHGWAGLPHTTPHPAKILPRPYWPKYKYTQIMSHPSY